jgi:hypothetical protein
MLFVNYLEKRLITIPVYNMIIAKQLVLLFLLYVVRYIGIPKTIVSN